MGTTGETYSQVFGTNTALFEQFVLWKNIMGPCWLKIEDADFGTLKNASHCKLEVSVDHPKMIATLPDSDNMEAPPLTMMSVGLRTTFNAKDNKQEILAISARIYENISLSDTTPANKIPSRTFTLIRPNGPAFPVGFEALAKDKKLFAEVEKENEAIEKAEHDPLESETTPDADTKAAAQAGKLIVEEEVEVGHVGWGAGAS